jgi:quinone-modifying oxidoreductase subunit QmoC
MTRGAPKVAYQSNLDPQFGSLIASTPGGENLKNCIQCGTCSGACPVSPYMDYTPREIIALTRAGFKDQVLNCFTIWLCASCYSCTVECPQGIKVTDIMYALKRKAIQEKTHPKHFPIPILAREFCRTVSESGRNSESWVAGAMYLKSNPFKHITKGLFAAKLWLAGRMRLRRERIKNVQELKAMLHALGH